MNENQTLDPTPVGAALLLQKYVTLLCAHVCEVLPVACTVASNGPRHFMAAAHALEEELAGVLLPELLVAMVLLQTYMSSTTSLSQTVPLLGGLLELLDRFNRLAPGLQKEDEEDLAWPCGSSNQLFPSREAEKEVNIIRPEDLENHNKDGGLWVVIHGKVYDLQDFKDQVCEPALYTKHGQM